MLGLGDEPPCVRALALLHAAVSNRIALFGSQSPRCAMQRVAFHTQQLVSE